MTLLSEPWPWILTFVHFRTVNRPLHIQNVLIFNGQDVF